MASENYVLLERTELNAAAASVTFANIPQTGYTDLKIVVSARLASGTGFMLLDFNGLSTANFSHRVLEGNGASAYSFVSGNTNYATGLVGGGDTANTFTNVEFYIPNYAGSTFKSVSIDGVTENNGTTAYADLEALLWSNTAAISQFKLTTSSAVNFAVGSTFSLYGIAAFGTTPVLAPKATGGNIVANDGTYWYHAFTSSGNFVPQTGLSCDVLVVAGGGGGGGVLGNQGGGGGGAGGVLGFSSQSFTTSQTVTIGAGGAGGLGQDLPFVLSNGTVGVSSTFGALTATVGGGYGAYGGVNGGPGGSGGGGGNFSGTGGAATSGQGNAGGAGNASSNQYGGSGGGAGAVGTTGGAGGAGTSSVTNWGSLSAMLTATGLGVSGYLAGGGGTASTLGGTAGGSGGGGAANKASQTNATSGTANTGSGGGAHYETSAGTTGAYGGNGGSGVVIIRYPIA